MIAPPSSACNCFSFSLYKCVIVIPYPAKVSVPSVCKSMVANVRCFVVGGRETCPEDVLRVFLLFLVFLLVVCEVVLCVCFTVARCRASHILRTATRGRSPSRIADTPLCSRSSRQNTGLVLRGSIHSTMYPVSEGENRSAMLSIDAFCDFGETVGKFPLCRSASIASGVPAFVPVSFSTNSSPPVYVPTAVNTVLPGSFSFAQLRCVPLVIEQVWYLAFFEGPNTPGENTFI